MPLVIPPFLKQRFSRPVAIFGAGISGEGVSELLHALAVNGVIYAIGGQDADFKPLTKVEAFIPGAGTLVAWAPKAPLPARR